MLCEHCSFSTGVKECTEAGIQFLMLDTYNQLWLLLKQYTEAAATGSGDYSAGFRDARRRMSQAAMKERGE